MWERYVTFHFCWNVSHRSAAAADTRDSRHFVITIITMSGKLDQWSWFLAADVSSIGTNLNSVSLISFARHTVLVHHTVSSDFVALNYAINRTGHPVSVYFSKIIFTCRYLFSIVVLGICRLAPSTGAQCSHRELWVRWSIVGSVFGWVLYTLN